MPALQKPVKIGLIEDLSGDLAIYGIQKYHAALLAVSEINAGLMLKGGRTCSPGMGVFAHYTIPPPSNHVLGANYVMENKKDETPYHNVLFSEESKILIKSHDNGLLGRKIELIAKDGLSNIKTWPDLTEFLIKSEKVDVLFAAFSSSSREMILPVINKNKQLYFYTNQYEGGVANKYTFCTGAVCEQQVIPLVEYMVRKFGNRFYTIAADYSFGRLSALWTQQAAEQIGGELIAEEFIPLGNSDFNAVVQRVKQAKPDWIMTLLIGAAQQNYYPRASAAGLRIPMASTVNMAQGFEHVRFNPPALANLYNAVNYMQEIPTVRNRAFVRRWFKSFPYDPYIGQMAQNTYFSIHLYANAVRLAGTTDQNEVIKAMESGLHIEAPEGSLLVSPSTHHVAHYIRLAKADENHAISFVLEWPRIGPWWLEHLGVNLVRHPEFKQYTPAEDPSFRQYKNSAKIIKY